MFIFVNQSWPTRLNHQWCKIFSKISSLVIESDRGCMLSIFLVFTRPTNGTVLCFFMFSAEPIFLDRNQRGFLDQQSLTLWWWNPFHVVWRGKKTLVVFSHRSLTRIIREVITLRDLQIILMNCCGFSEVMTYSLCCLPSTYTQLNHPPLSL